MSEHHSKKRKLNNVTNDNIFINFRKYNHVFQGNSHNLKKIIVEASGNIFLDDINTTIKLIEGKKGVNAIKGM
ncbi:MAG: hypothetical protein ACI94Y_002627 [Maribacter sp.]